MRAVIASGYKVEAKNAEIHVSDHKATRGTFFKWLKMKKVYFSQADSPQRFAEKFLEKLLSELESGTCSARVFGKR
jgi:hypothetical protein